MSSLVLQLSVRVLLLFLLTTPVQFGFGARFYKSAAEVGASEPIRNCLLRLQECVDARGLPKQYKTYMCNRVS